MCALFFTCLLLSALVNNGSHSIYEQSKIKIETKPEKESTPKPDKKEKENVAPSSPPATPAKPAMPTQPDRRQDKKDKWVILLERILVIVLTWKSEMIR